MSTSEPRSFITLVLFLSVFVQGLPIYDHYLPDRGQVVAFWPWQSTPSDKFGLRPVQEAIQLLIDDKYDSSTSISTKMVGIHNSPGATVLTPYQQKPTVPAAPHPRPSASRIPHASMPVQTEHASHSKTPITVGAVLGVLLTVLAIVATARCIVRRLRSDSPGITLDTPQPAEKFLDHFLDPPRSKSIFEFKFKPSASNESFRPNRLSNESWVTRETSPHSTLKRSTSPPPLPQILARQDLGFPSYAFPRERKLVLVTTPVCTPSDVTVFGSRVELATEKGKEDYWGDANGQGEQRHFIRPGEIYVPLVRVPSPAYVSPSSPSLPMSPSPSFRHSPTLSPTPSTEALIRMSPTSSNADTIANLRPSGNRLSRLLASSFRDTRENSFRAYSYFSHTSMIATQTDASAHGATNAIAPGTSTPYPVTTNTRHSVRATAAHLIGAVRPYTNRQSGSTINSLYARAPGRASVPSSLRAGGARSRRSFYGAEGTSSVRSSLAFGNSVGSGLSFGFGFGTSETGGGYMPLSEERGGRRNMGRVTERGWEITKDGGRDTMTTITTQDTTLTSPYLSRAAVYALLYGRPHIQAPSTTTSTTVSPSPSITTYVSPSPSTAASLIVPVAPSASISSVTGPGRGVEAPTETPLGLKVRLSDASEHELFRGREKERERERQRERAQEQLARDNEKDDSTRGEKENLKGRERRWKPPGSPSSPSSISRKSRSRSVSPSPSPSPPSPSPSISLSPPKTIYTSMSPRLPHAHARVQTQNRARAQTSPKPSIYHSPTSPRADPTARLLFRERASTVSRVAVVHRNADTGREHHHHGRPHRDVSPYTSIVTSPPPSPSLSSSRIAAREVMPDPGPSAPTGKDGREGRGCGRGIDRPPSTHGRTKSAPGARVPLVRSHRHSQSQSQFQSHSRVHFRPHVHLHAGRRDVPGCPPSHGGEQGTECEGEGDEHYEDEASFSDASDERRRTRYGLRDSETVLRNIGW